MLHLRILNVFDVKQLSLIATVVAKYDDTDSVAVDVASSNLRPMPVKQPDPKSII